MPDVVVVPWPTPPDPADFDDPVEKKLAGFAVIQHAKARRQMMALVREREGLTPDPADRV